MWESFLPSAIINIYFCQKQGSLSMRLLLMFSQRYVTLKLINTPLTHLLSLLQYKFRCISDIPTETRSPTGIDHLSSEAPASVIIVHEGWSALYQFKNSSKIRSQTTAAVNFQTNNKGLEQDLQTYGLDTGCGQRRSLTWPKRALAKSSFCCLCDACSPSCSLGMALNITSHPAAQQESLSGWTGRTLVLGTQIRKGIASIWEKALGQSLRYRVKFHLSEGKKKKCIKEKYCQMSVYY